jgi:hypothetical protein
MHVNTSFDVSNTEIGLCFLVDIGIDDENKIVGNLVNLCKFEVT